MRIRNRTLLITILLVLGLALASCSGKTEPEAPLHWQDCLGGYSYDSPIIAMVYEQVEGEEEGMYGIQYREVTDLAHLTSQQEIPVCLYFYSSLRSDLSGMTAGMEDLAQELNGRVVIVAVDEAVATDIADAYRVEDVPYCILLDKAARISSLEAKDPNGEYIDAADVASWLASALAG